MTGDTLITAAAAQAAAAAHEAGVVVRQVTDISELASVEQLYDEIWGPGGNPPVNTEMLRAFSKAGNYVAGAFAGDGLAGGDLAGACVGFFSAPAAGVLHSHIAGVAGRMAGRHVGYALKLDQRAWSLAGGIRAIEWTFDPLVARNAYFNIVKLAGRPAEYLPNFYGGMRDAINANDDSDRLLLRWDLTEQRVADACSRRREQTSAAALQAGGAACGLSRGAHGEPVPGRSDAPVVLVAVPRDIEQLRATDTGLAKDWRFAVRDVLGALMSDGALITGFDRDGWYVVQRTERSSPR